jgi:hypothetical protein
MTEQHKVQPRRIPSDGCRVTDGDDEYYPHAGEHILWRPGTRVGELAVLTQWASIQSRMDAIDGTPAERMAAQAAILTEFAQQAAPVLAARIVGWDWTDDDGEPLPPPRQDPAVFERLDLDELNYLIGLLAGNEPEQAKNGSRPSPTTSSDTQPPRILELSGAGLNRSLAE